MQLTVCNVKYAEGEYKILNTARYGYKEKEVIDDSQKISLKY